MNTKNIEQIEKEIKKILSDRISEEIDIKKQLENENINITKINKAIEKARDNGDKKAYLEAKTEKRIAEETKEMYRERLDILKNKPLISKTDYEDNVLKIYKEIKEIEEQEKEKLAELSNKMKSIGIELMDVQKHANEVLHKLQHDIYRDADRRKDTRGNIYSIFDEKRVEVAGTIRWANSGVENLKYKEFVRNNKEK